jgi:hypothetical protein
MPSKRYRVLVYGIPGLGKSTLALSAPKPLWVDTDRGIDRVDPVHRVPYIQPASYQEILDDLKPENPDLSSFETIVLDTGGALFDFMSDWIIRRNPKAGKSNGALSLQGFGEVAAEFKRLTEYVSRVLGKHLVITFHAREDKDNDTAKWRPDVPGSTKNEVWKPVDLGGFMEARANKRTISFFAMDERYLAKGNRNVNEVYDVPELAKGRANDFLSSLFARLDSAEVDNASELEAYHAVMARVSDIVANVDDAETANAALESIKALPHVFASKDESWAKLTAKTVSKGLKFDSVAKRFS